MRRLLYALPLAASLLMLGSANGCSLDGKPSAFANGVRAVIVKGAPTVKTWSWWAHFAFPVAFRAGRRIVFHEDDAQVRTVIQPVALRRPWRWRFSDGAAVIGDRATHVYRRPGRYRVYVDAYFPVAGPVHGWQPFDTITITVRR